MRASSALAALAAAAVAVNGQQTGYGQCGGTGWTGYTGCVDGLKCLVINKWFSQCVPDSIPGPTASTPTTTSTPALPTATLRPNFFWIRAVAAPNFHKYLQSPAPGQTGAAILGPASTAGQFFLVYGRLILVGAGVELDASVSDEVIGRNEDGTGGRRAVTFREGPGVGAGEGFVYSGDTVGWRRGGEEREDRGAWLVCGGGQLFVNLGRVGEAPEGCVDQTIHFYWGTTAEV